MELLCPVVRCRGDAIVPMVRYGIAMFFACPAHAQVINDDDWAGWCLDWDYAHWRIYRR